MPTDTLTPILAPYIDSTMMTTFRACPRRFYNEFVFGLRPSGLSVHLHAGGAFAHALEVTRKEIFLNGRGISEALLRASAAFEIYWGDFEAPVESGKSRDRVWEAVEDYFRTYPPLTDHIQPYQVDGKPTFEFTFAIPLDLPGFPLHPVTGEPFLYSGRFDMLGEYLGMPVIEDDKTGSTGFYTGWTEKWELRSQFIGYTWACQMLGLPVNTCVVRGIGILKTKIHHAEAIKPYSDHVRSLWLEQLRRDLHRLVASWNEGYWDYNLGDSCTTFGNCMYIQPCQSPNPEPWLKTMDVRRWNPLQPDPTKDQPNV